MAIFNGELSKPFFIAASVLLLLSCTILSSSLLVNRSLLVGHHRVSDHASAVASIKPKASAQTHKVPIPFGFKATLRTSSPNDTARLLHGYDQRYDTTW